MKHFRMKISKFMGNILLSFVTLCLLLHKAPNNTHHPCDIIKYSPKKYAEARKQKGNPKPNPLS